MKKLLILLAVLALPRLAAAQTSLPDTYTSKVYVAGTATVVGGESFAASAATCNLPPPVAIQAVNPDTYVYDDPVNVGMVCTYTNVGFFAGFPVGSYETTLIASNLGGSSPESIRSNVWSRMGPPATPGHPKVTKK